MILKPALRFAFLRRPKEKRSRRSAASQSILWAINDTYTAFDTGVVDVIMSGGSTINSFKFGEVAKFFHRRTSAQRGRRSFLAHEQGFSYDALPAAIRQAIIDQTSGRDLSLKGAAFYVRAGKGSRSRKSANLADHEVIEMLAPEEVAKGLALIERVACRCSDLGYGS